MKRLEVFSSLAAVLACLLTQNAARASATVSFLNQPGPELVVEQWLTPIPITSGKFILLEFWATWCPSCRKSIPHLNQIQSKFSEKLAVIGLSDEPENVIRAMPGLHPVYFSAIDSQRRTVDRVGVQGIPHLLVVDPGGLVRWEGHPLNLKEAKLEQLLQAWNPPKPAPTVAAVAPPASPAALAAPPKPKKRFAFELKDGRRIEGEWVGSFGARTTVLTDDRIQIDLKTSEIVKREELAPRATTPSR